MNIFDIDLVNLHRLKKFYRNSPKQFKKATVMLLNNFAFGVRAETLKFLSRKMIVRDKRFVSSRLQVTKARPGNTSSQVSTVGSVPKKQFTGWREQELGIPTADDRTASLLARRGSKRKKMVAGARLKPSVEFPDSENYFGEGDNRVYSMLSKLGRENYKKAFIIKRHSKFKSGLYKFRGRKRKSKSGKKIKYVKMLQRFSSPNTKPKRLRWMLTSRINYFRKADLKTEWSRVLSRLLKVK